MARRESPRFVALKLLVHVFVLAYGTWTLPRKTWFHADRWYERDHADPHVNVLYAVYAAHCAAALVVEVGLLGVAPIFVVHHLVAAALVSFSWHHGLTRAGALVMTLLAPTDVIFSLHALTRRRMTHVLLPCFAACWLLTRLILLPYMIWRTAVADAPAGAVALLSILQGTIVVWTCEIASMLRRKRGA